MRVHGIAYISFWHNARKQSSLSELMAALRVWHHTDIIESCVDFHYEPGADGKYRPRLSSINGAL